MHPPRLTVIHDPSSWCAARFGQDLASTSILVQLTLANCSDCSIERPLFLVLSATGEARRIRKKSYATLLRIPSSRRRPMLR
uniref:Uncharacterized protein n=1 Tax=Pseudomonas putida TaxID=303 RepID=A0A1W6QXU7_PSEPU|nr:Hypothetical protein [Pseudomonas putida]